MKITDEFVVDGAKREIVRAIILQHKLSKVFLRTLIAKHGTEHNISYFKKFTIVFIFIPEYLAKHLRTLHASLKGIHYCLWINQLALINKLILDFVDSRKGVVKKIVEFKRQTVTASGTLFLFIPQFRIHTPFEGRFKVTSNGCSNAICLILPESA